MENYDTIEISNENRIGVISLNRPKVLNAINERMVNEVTRAMHHLNNDESIACIILRGNGRCFSAGFDMKETSQKSIKGESQWRKELTKDYDFTMQFWHSKKPTIASVHGYCLAGGTELAASCDLVYVANDVKIGYPVVRSMSPPDNQIFPWLMGMRHAMEMMLTGESIDGETAVEQGFANRSFDVKFLEEEVLKIAEKVAKVPSDLQAINKRAVHRQMEAMGMRTGIRAGTEMQALAMHSKSTQEHLKELSSGLKEALTKRDEEFGDYRTSKKD